MPCCERESTSLIAVLLDAVISSGSFRRSLMGRVIRCTYFLLANGCVTRLTRFGSSPSQKSVAVCGGSGSSTLSFVVEVAGGAVVSLCCANPGRVRAENRNANKSDVVAMRIFILTYPFEWRSSWDPLQPEG